MRFLTSEECQAWCRERGIPLRKVGWVRPHLEAPDFQFVDVPYETDSGSKVNMARFLFSLVSPVPETLLWLDEWDVWPSSQHMPMFKRFRQAFGENRPLGESPGHLVTVDDADDAVSIIATALLFFWDCYGFSGSGRDAVDISHDEFCRFASRDAETAARVRKELTIK